MSNYELRPNVNRAERVRDYPDSGGGFGFWVLVAGIAVVVLFAIVFFSGGGESTFEGAGDASVVVPDSPESAPAAGAPLPATAGE